MNDIPAIVLINPWIYDFAAYDFWSKPLGLLYLAAYLRKRGCRVHLIDCLDLHHPEVTGHGALKRPKRHLYGTGKFLREAVSRPSSLQHIPRPYSRYGLAPDIVEKELRGVATPSAIIVSSLMTYWYPGVQEAIGLARRIHPGVPVVLGGIYARLCRDHAVTTSGADTVVSGHDVGSLSAVLEAYGIHPPEEGPCRWTELYPSFDLLTGIDAVPILTSVGCPYQCPYCASHFLSPHIKRREPESVVEEIAHWHTRYGIRDFAFYDDALLVEFDGHAGPILEGLARLGLDCRFHTPNALHVREISREAACLMRRTGFRTIRLGLETSAMPPHRDLDGKVSRGDFEAAMRHLREAGFSSREVGAYVLVGLPEQDVGSIVKTIRFVAANGGAPYLAEYSPIPHTALWQKAVASSRYDLMSDPLFHNNTLMPCWDDPRRRELPRIKRLALEMRELLKQGSHMTIS